MRALRRTPTLLSNSPIRFTSAREEHACRNNYLPSLSVNRGSQSFRNILVGGHAWILAWLPLQNFLDPIQHYTLVCVAEERNGIALGNNIRAAGRFHNLVRRSSQLVVGPALKHLQEEIFDQVEGLVECISNKRMFVLYATVRVQDCFDLHHQHSPQYRPKQVAQRSTFRLDVPHGGLLSGPGTGE
jgi:hypothetical protein